MWKKILLALFLIAIGFWIGRTVVRYDTVVKYVKGDTIHDTITNIIPYIVEKQLPPKTVDTSKIIEEYFNKNKYSETLFDNDTLGKMTVSSIIQYNKLTTLEYQFTPIYRQVTQYRTKKYIPFITTSVNTFGMFGAGVGCYKGGLGIEFKYLTDFNKKGIGMGLHFKF